MNILKQYISTGSRYKLLFTSHHVEEVAYADLGYLLANAIGSYLHVKHLPVLADEAIEKIINAKVAQNSIIGDYIAIHNIGILFEPALQLNVHSKFYAWTKTKTVIVPNTEGVIKNNIFYLAGTTDQTFSINLSDISYNIISDEI